MIIVSGNKPGISRVSMPIGALPKSIDPIEVTPLPALQQVGGTCCAFAMAQLLRYVAQIYPDRVPATWKNPSPFWLLYHALILDGMGDEAFARGGEGTWVHSVMAAVKYYGVNTMVKSEYERFSVGKRYSPTPNAIMEAYKSKMHNLQPIRIDGSLESSPLPVICTIPVYEEIQRVGETMLRGEGPSIGLHAWVYLGKREGKHLLQSSWGNSWGGQGNGCIYATDNYVARAYDKWTWS